MNLLHIKQIYKVKYVQYVDEKIYSPKDYHYDIYCFNNIFTAYGKCIKNIRHKNKRQNALYKKA